MKELWEHCLCPTNARTVTTLVMKENDKFAQLADESCSWESIQMDAGGERLSEEEISVCSWGYEANCNTRGCVARSVRTRQHSLGAVETQRETRARVPKTLGSSVRHKVLSKVLFFNVRQPHHVPKCLVGDMSESGTNLSEVGAKTPQ